ncbi:unnamed protein product [Ceutorhynchus assimilis]|uniref:Uncharacterized protein n=1 Tax=Ceutorhynchus assimilis TaxID=467358 RepID=A0A9N9MNZ9_9CUCU|nr:unnamed protein product [Ceutorhynchus assimilis]
MKLYAVLVVIVVLNMVHGQKYTTKYDNLNIDTILSNKRVLGNYVKCILDEGPCTAEGRELKTHLPEALRTNCVKCTNSQKDFVRKGANFLIKNQPDDWKRISGKYDPQGKFSEQFQRFLEA